MGNFKKEHKGGYVTSEIELILKFMANI